MNKNLFKLILLFLLGVITAKFLEWPENINVVFLGLVFLVLILLTLKGGNKTALILLSFFFFILGLFRYSSDFIRKQNDVSYFASETSKQVVIQGIVVQDPEGFDNGRVRFTVKAIKLLDGEHEFNVTGRIFVKIFSYDKKLQMGDIIVIGGKLKSPKEGKDKSSFSWKDYLESQGIFACLTSKDIDIFSVVGRSHSPIINIKRGLFMLRRKASNILRKFTYGDTRDILESVILGNRQGLSKKVKNTFARTGTMHILAVSGLHIGLLGLIALGILRFLRCSKQVSCYITIFCICMFSVLTGARASSLRAAIMGSVALFVLSRGQRVDLVGTLILSAFIITFLNPAQLFQVGFILSFGAVLSIIYVTPIVEKFLHINNTSVSMSDKIRLFFTKSISVSTSVWLGTFPVTLFYFNLITPYVIFANLIAVPVLFLIVILGLSLLFMGSIALLEPLVRLFAVFTSWVISVFLELMRSFEAFPFSYFEIEINNYLLVLVYYFVLILALFCYNKKLS